MFKNIFFVIIWFYYCSAFWLKEVIDREELKESIIVDNSPSAIQTNDIDKIIVFFKDFIFALLWLILIAVFLYIWTRLIISRWNWEEFKKATMQLVYAIVWLFFVSAAYLFVRLISWIVF